ncbi:MAG: lysylphosphatidylglycerol synthase transmembrane domain-containing protein [Planctomycetota bacterium]|nr:lysylphosphatidylglycerol synthase transmembrane domain-containing protein [Planctomycetota bacterium]
MSKARKPLLMLLRLLVSAGLIYYVITLISFYDRIEIECTDGRVVSGTLKETSETHFVVETDSGETARVPRAEVKPGSPRVRCEGLFTVVRKLRWRVFLPFFFLYPVGIIVSAARWRILLRAQEIGATLWQALRFSYIGIFFNNFMLGLTGGDIMKAYMVARNTDRKASAIMTIFLDRLVGVVALATVAGLVLPFNLDRPAFRQPALVIYSFLAAFVVFGSLYYSRRIRRTRAFQWFKGLLPFKKVLKEADASLLLYRQKRGALGAAFAMSLFAHALAIVVCFGSGVSIGISEAKFLDYFMFFPVIIMIISLPISLGGWGLGEALFAHFFGLVGVPGEQAVLLSLVGRFMGLIWTLPGGIFLALGSTKAALTEMRREADATLFD